MRVVVTGATGMIGSALVLALRERGDEIVALSRDAARGRAKLGEGVEVHAWPEPAQGPPPAEALAGAAAIVNLLGEPVAQRWSDGAKRRIHDSREQGTGNLVEGLRAVQQRPSALVSASAVGYYGPHGGEPLPEDTPPAGDFLARVCVVWEAEAEKAEALGVRVVRVRTGVVLDKEGGALGKMLPFFKAGIGGPVAGGGQYMPWIHADDVVGIYLRALDDAGWSGPVNATAPEPVTNREFSKALGRALHRPALAPVPAFAIRILYGEMAEIVTEGQNAVPRRTLELGYRHRHADLDRALRAALGSD
jgi:uncharacterized protein